MPAVVRPVRFDEDDSATLRVVLGLCRLGVLFHAIGWALRAVDDAFVELPDHPAHIKEAYPCR